MSPQAGVIGAGGRIRDIARRLRAVAPGIRISDVYDPSPGSIEAVRRDVSPDVRVCGDYRSLCESEEIDWVMIGSPNAFHREHAVAALQGGKHVFCEKPLATTLEDCLAIRDALAAAPACMFSFGLTLRYASLYRRIHELLDAGAVGRLISFEFNETLAFNHGGYIHQDWRRFRRLAGTHLLEKCCHDVDLANWFTGSLPRRAASFGGLDFFTSGNAGQQERIGPSAEGRPAYQGWAGSGESPFRDDKDIVDNQVAILEYANGVRATFHTNCNAGIPERRMYLLGSEGAIRADLLAGRLERCRIGWEEPLQVEMFGDGSGHGDGDEYLVRQLAGSMLRGEAPFAGIREGLTSAIACFGIDRACDEETVVNLEPMWREAGIAMTEGEGGAESK